MNDNKCWTLYFSCVFVMIFVIATHLFKRKTECPKCPEVTAVEKKEKDLKKVCPSEFQVFKKAYWPSYIQNECMKSKLKKCCVNDRNDTGGLTCYGVAINYNHSFFEYLEKIKKLPYQTDVHFIDSTPIEPYAQMKIYLNYFLKPKINELPIQLREVVFDASVHAGPARAIRILQRACGTRPDGRVGDNTISRCKDLSADKYISARKEWLKTRPSWRNYKKGFTNRLNRQKKQAIDVLNSEKKLVQYCK